MKFNPDRDIPSLAGKVIFITGGTAGLGAGSVAELARHEPAHIFFSGRNQKSADALIEKVGKQSPDVKVTFIKCDMSSFASVQQAADNFKVQSDRLDILMLNAGIMAVDAAVSVDGYETQFATNHLGHALLVKLLMPILRNTAKQTGDARIINMTSIAHDMAPKKGFEFATIKSKQDGLGGMIPGGKWTRYGQSKLAQLVYSEELAKHYPDILSISVHPGFIMTALFDNVDFFTRLPALIKARGQTIPVEEGHYRQVWAATCEKSQLKNGEYYDDVGKVGKRLHKQASNEQVANELWTWTQNAMEDYN